MLWRVSISLLFLRLCQGAPTDPSGPNGGGPSQGGQQPNVVPPADTKDEEVSAFWQRCYQTGVMLAKGMVEEDAGCLEQFKSPFTVNDFNDPNDGVWKATEHGADALTALQKAIPELEGLVGVELFESPESSVKWSDENLWYDETRSLDPSPEELEWRNLMSGSNRFIISLLAESSVIQDLKRGVEGETKLRDWSDVTFLQYGYLRSIGATGERDQGFLTALPGGSVSWHKQGTPIWFLQHDVEVLEDVYDIVNFCLGTHHKWKLTGWPGVTFPIGSSCYLALLGSEMGVELAMVFIRYRMIIGRGTLGSVTVFKGRDGKTNMLWWAAYDSATIDILWPEISEKNAHSDAAAMRSATPSGAFPYPLTPVRAQGAR